MGSCGCTSGRASVGWRFCAAAACMACWQTRWASARPCKRRPLLSVRLFLQFTACTLLKDVADPRKECLLQHTYIRMTLALRRLSAALQDERACIACLLLRWAERQPCRARSKHHHMLAVLAENLCHIAACHLERRAQQLPHMASLILCPPTLVPHWPHEIQKFVGSGQVSIVQARDCTAQYMHTAHARGRTLSLPSLRKTCVCVACWPQTCHVCLGTSCDMLHHSKLRQVHTAWLMYGAASV